MATLAFPVNSPENWCFPLVCTSSSQLLSVATISPPAESCNPFLPTLLTAAALIQLFSLCAPKNLSHRFLADLLRVSREEMFQPTHFSSCASSMICTCPSLQTGHSARVCLTMSVSVRGETWSKSMSWCFYVHNTLLCTWYPQMVQSILLNGWVDCWVNGPKDKSSPFNLGRPEKSLWSMGHLY